MLDAGATGVGRYADTLLETYRTTDAPTLVLAALSAARKQPWDWIAALPLSPRVVHHDEAKGQLCSETQIFRQAQAHFDLYRRLLPLTTLEPAGVMHWTYPVPLHMVGWLNVYTVHDAIPLQQPELTPIDAHRHRRLMRAIARKADRLITVSETSRQEIAAETDYDTARIVTIAQGVKPLPAGTTLPDGLVAGGYFLFYGSLEPRKNLIRLMKAHADSGVTRPLVLAGPDGWRADEVLRQAAGRPGIVRLPYQTLESLGALVHGARAVLFPSLAEGFGLPVIEAMIMGTPVMTSAHGALRETAGGAALLVDPLDCAAMARAILRLDTDGALTDQLASAGRHRACAFSIPRYAERLMAFHADLMSTAA